MKKRIIACIYVLMLIVCLKLSFSYLYNEHMIHKYEQNDYSADASPLLFCNFFQPYLAHYNMGNIHYQNEQYADAISEYQEALALHPGKKRECSVRINLALAMIQAMGEDYASAEKREDSIATLKEARNILLEDGCATEDGDGHSEKAEQLKREIDQMIEELEQSEESQSDDTDSKDDSKEQQEETYEKNIEETLQQQQEDAYKERTDALQYYEELDNDMNYELDGRIW